MLSLCFSLVVTVMSPFRSSVFHFLAKLSKICEIFFSCEKKTMKLSLLHKNLNTSSHRKGNLMALTTVYQFELWLKVGDQQIIITRDHETWFELSKFSSYSRSSQPSWTVLGAFEICGKISVTSTQTHNPGEEAQLHSGWISIRSELSSLNFNSLARAEQSFAIHYPNIMITSLYGNLDICLNYYATPLLLVVEFCSCAFSYRLKDTFLNRAFRSRS